MADLEFYKLSMTGEEADRGIRTGMEAGATSGVLLGDGQGGVTAAIPGRDFGYPLLEGNDPPTGNTAANIGQHYFDMQATAAPYEYICVGLNSNGFIWLVFGDAGNGFIVSGYFTSIDALNAAIAEGIVPAPTPGVNYAIGTEPPYDTVTWDGVANDWKNNGPLGASGGGSGVPPHGTTGQVLTKLSDLDGDAGWKDIALNGEGAPTASTVGMIGQLYVDTTANENPAYICVGISTADNVTSYVWQPVGGTIEDGSITAEKLAPNAIPDALGFNPGMVNPNLLDNWYFVGGGSQQGGDQFPINQRGQTSYVASAYGIDRWKLELGTGVYGEMRLEADGLRLVNYEASTDNAWFTQYIPAYGDGITPFTLSSLANEITGDCKVYFGGSNIGVAMTNGLTTNTFQTVNGTVGTRIVLTPGSSCKIQAVKLERSSKQTFAHQENGQWVLNEIPNYGEQLARCQLDYIAIPNGVISVGRSYGDGLWRFLVNTPVEMRINPSIIVNNTGAAYVYGSYIPLSSLAVISKVPGGVLISGTSSTSGLGDRPAVLVDADFQLNAER